MSSHRFHGSMLQEAYTSGMNDRTNHYRRILNLYMRVHEAVVVKHNAEVEVYRISGKLKLFEEIFNDGVMNHVEDKLEKELSLAHSRLADVKVPNLDWGKLGEPQMWR
ncbi:unnamed protein product [Eruca vesicaria subsp. sativa]|uniref:Uncharacterized protein n=1 Tax=Eruca vesicaria subsp. sativa TaxID=29727 RepID=A0ABC8M6A0_ERUVS|nr:unnamed protein product [Eruca vesicaria subsp. sativa]